jgi:hypothetical protein
MRLYLTLPLVGLLATAAACASAQAKGANEKPALNVPPPPQHQIELPAEPLEPVGEVPGTVPDLPPAPPRTGRPPATRPQAGDAKPETKAEPPKDTPAATPASPEPAPGLPPPAGSPQLRTPQTADTTAAKSVRTTIDRARSTLSTVNLGTQTSERKKAYHDAELFLQQAEDALKDGNIVFAQAVATKAETLAKELAGR